MELSNKERAEVLTQALPYIKKYHNQTVVVKYGGNAMTDPVLKKQVMADVAMLSLIGVRIVLVHGGGPEMTALMEKLGKQTMFVDGLRVTDEETLDIAKMVLAGKINKDLVNLINHQGGNAIGISGIDAGMIKAKMKDEALGYVGEIVSVNSNIVSDLLEHGYIPVISTIASDDSGNIYNVNADTAASKIAVALGARRLIMMTNVAGILKDPNDDKSLISEMSLKEAKSLRSKDEISGGMIPKIDCCIEALSYGVSSAVILDGRIPHSLMMELLTDEGAGTIVKK